MEYVEFPSEPFRAEEVRFGLPLVYVGTKLDDSLVGMHDVFCSIRDHVPPNLYAPHSRHGNPFSLRDDYLLGPLAAAFRGALVALLALYNLTRLLDTDLVQRLLDGSHDELRTFLRHVEDTGSVLGGDVT